MGILLKLVHMFLVKLKGVNTCEVLSSVPGTFQATITGHAHAHDDLLQRVTREDDVKVLAQC